MYRLHKRISEKFGPTTPTASTGTCQGRKPCPTTSIITSTTSHLTEICRTRVSNHYNLRRRRWLPICENPQKAATTRPPKETTINTINSKKKKRTNKISKTPRRTTKSATTTINIANATNDSSIQSTIPANRKHRLRWNDGRKFQLYLT